MSSFNRSFRNEISAKEILKHIKVYDVSRPNNLYNDTHIQENTEDFISHVFNELTFKLPLSFKLKEYSYVKPGFKELVITDLTGGRVALIDIFFSSFSTQNLDNSYIWKVQKDTYVERYYGYERDWDISPRVAYFLKQGFYVKVYSYDGNNDLSLLLSGIQLK